MHTTLVRPALRKQLQVETVAHTTGNIHEKHKHIFVFGVESLHLKMNPYMRSTSTFLFWSAHVSAQPTTKKLMAAVRV